MARLVPLLEKHRGGVPLEFLLGWIDVESAGRIDVTPRSMSLAASRSNPTNRTTGISITNG